MAMDRKLPPVGEEIHLPGPSAQPLLLALFSTIAIVGVTIATPVPFIIGAVGIVLVLFAWIRDAVAEFKALPDHHGHGDEHHADAADGEPAAH